MSDSLQPHESQPTRPPCPSQTPGVYSNSCPRVSDAIQPSHPLSSPSPPVPNLSQHQGLFQWVSSLHEVAKALESQYASNSKCTHLVSKEVRTIQDLITFSHMNQSRMMISLRSPRKCLLMFYQCLIDSAWIIFLLYGRERKQMVALSQSDARSPEDIPTQTTWIKVVWGQLLKRNTRLFYQKSWKVQLRS